MPMGREITGSFFYRSANGKRKYWGGGGGGGVSIAVPMEEKVLGVFFLLQCQWEEKVLFLLSQCKG